MKKILLAIATVLIAISASATPFSVAKRLKPVPDGYPYIQYSDGVEFNQENSVISRASSSDEAYYSLAGSPAGVAAHPNQTGKSQLAMAFQMEPTFVSALSEGQITEISFYTGSNKYTRENKITKATVFITDNLYGDFLYTQSIDNLPTTPLSKIDVTLNTPFSIPTGSKIYVGVYFSLTNPLDYALVADGLVHYNDYGGWVGIRDSDSASWSWDNTTAELGFYTLGATVKSKAFPKNLISVVELAAQPIGYQNQPLPVQFIIQNNGVNNITSFTVECSIENEPPVTKDLHISADAEFGMNQMLIAGVELTPNNAYKNATVTVNIKKIDGEANASENASGSSSVVIVPEDAQFKRNVVVEEFTSTNCVYCPSGYTAMEKIRENYPDGNVIPVCVHINFQGKDPMTATSFSALANKYGASIPASTINREYNMYPSYNTLVEYIDGITALPAIGEVSAKAHLDTETRMLTINSETSFAFDYTDGDKNFILAYAITEDGLGPYSQKNGYSITNRPLDGDWDKLPSTVSLIFNDVARQLDKYPGITGSIPTEITAGETYKYSHELKLLSTIEDFNRIHVIVYLINLKSGVIENAYTLTSDGNGNYAGIEQVVVDNDEDAPVEYYNLQGVRVKNPANGVYIRRQGNKVSKVLLH